MTREFATVALIFALALPACASEETNEAEGGEEMTQLNEAEQSEQMTELSEAERSEEMTEMAAAASTVQSELLADLSQLRDKYTGLAEAMPESDYGWRPADGVRSVSEVYMHVAAANVGIVMRAMGTELPEGDAYAWYDEDAESLAGKAAVVAALGASFDYLAAAIEGTSDDNLVEAMDLFGLSSLRAVLTFTLAHCHEHLGQSIAYARSNGVAPPWSM